VSVKKLMPDLAHLIDLVTRGGTIAGRRKANI